MANNPYTKDITKSSAYRQVTNQNQDKLGQVLEGAVQIKKAFNNKVESNVQALQESKVIEIQKKKLMLKGLNGVSNIQNDIRDNYNNNVAAWSRDYAQKELKSEAISRFGLEETEKNGITLNHPNSAYGKWLKKRAQGIEDNYTKLVTQLDSVGLPYKNLEEGSTFVDNVYQSAFNGLNRNNKFNIINSVGSLFKGHGLGNKSSSELKAEFNSNIANSSISKLESINNTFKALYASNPELAKDYETAIENADIRQNVDQKYGEVIIDKRYDRETGKTIEHKYREITTNYTDKKGNPRSITTLQTIEGDNTGIDRTDPATTAQNLTYLKMLDQEGHEAYFTALEDGNLEPHQAFMALRKKYGKSLTTLEADAERKRMLPEIMTAWKGIQDSYIFTNPMTGEQSYRPEIQRYLDGQGPKPSNYYNNMGEYAKDVIGVALGVAPMNKDFIFPDGKTVAVVSGLSDSPEWKAFTSNSEQIQEIKDEIGMGEEEEKEFLKDFEAGIYANVDKNGNYFPQENEDLLRQTYDSKRRVLLEPAALEAMGLETSMFPRGVRVGYNVKTKTLAFQSVSDDFVFQVQPEEEDPTKRPEGGIMTMGLQALNDIPYLGAGTEFLFGDTYETTDLLYAVPLGGGLVFTAKVIFKVGQKIVPSMIVKAQETIGRKLVQKGYDPFKEGAKLGTMKGSILGRSVDYQSIGKDLLTKGYDPIKKGTGMLIGKTKTGKAFRIGSVGTAAYLEGTTTPSSETE